MVMGVLAINCGANELTPVTICDVHQLASQYNGSMRWPPPGGMAGFFFWFCRSVIWRLGRLAKQPPATRPSLDAPCPECHCFWCITPHWSGAAALPVHGTEHERGLVHESDPYDNLRPGLTFWEL